MSKNMTRKGLAIGAGLALVGSGLVASPAAAAGGTLLTSAYYGVSTQFGAVASTDYGIVLNTTFAALDAAHDADNLKYKVEIKTAGYETDAANADAALANLTFVAAVDSNTANQDFGAGEAVDNQPAATDGNPVAVTTRWGNAADPAYGQILVLPAKQAAEGNAGAGVASAVAPDTTDNNLLRLVLNEELTETLTVEVTAWVDTIANNKADANEPIGSAVTVTFVPLAKAALTFGMVTPVIGATSLTAYATISGVNMGNFDKVAGLATLGNKDIEAYIIDRPGAVAAGLLTANAAAANVLEQDLVYVALRDRLEAAITPNGGTVVAGDYDARFSLAGAAADEKFAGNTSVTLAEGTAANSALDADAGEGVGKATVTNTSSVAQNNGATTAAGVDILAKAETATTLNFTSQLYKTYSTTAPVYAPAGVVVTVTISRANIAKLDADSVITSGGETLSGNKLSISYTTTTDANGVASFSLKGTGTAADEIEIDLSAEGKTATQQTLKWVDSAYSLYVSNTGTIKAAIGGSASFDFTAVDQFGQVPTGSAQVALTIASQSAVAGERNEVAEYSNYSYNVPLTAGKGSVTVTDNGSATLEGTDNLSAQLQVAATAGGGYVNKGTAATFSIKWVDDYATATLDAAANNNGVVTGATATAPIAIESLALANYDDRFDSAVAPAYDFTNGYTTTAKAAQENVYVSGNVKSAAGVGIASVPVTISGKGMLFATAAGSGRYAVDSITVLTGANGDYKVFVLGSLGGVQTVSVAGAGKSTSVALTFAANTGAAKSWTLTTPASVGDGKTADAVVKVVDKYGNAVSGVSVTFKETGPGYLNTTSATTDADGEAIVNLITVSGDTGTSTITASATIDGKSAQLTKTVTVGAVAASADQKVNAGSFKGYVALYAKGYAGKRMSAKVGKDWVVVPVLASNFERVVEFTGAGYTISVPIYIDRVLVDTIVVTTK